MKSAGNDADYDDPNMFFEYWSSLAKSDPERFERERAAEIEKVIVSAKPERQKGLRHLQWRIDMERMRAKNPIDSMIRLNKMMWKQFYAEDGFIFAVKQLQRVCHSAEELVKEPVKKDAEILQFKKD